MRTINEVLVLILDGVPDSQGEVFDKAGLEFRNYVWVTDEFKQGIRNLLGTAFLYLGKDGNLYADITIERDSYGPVTVFPGVGGVVKERVGNVIKRTEIFETGLHARPNADLRIPQITVPALLIAENDAPTPGAAVEQG